MSQKSLNDLLSAKYGLLHPIMDQIKFVPSGSEIHKRLISLAEEATKLDNEKSEVASAYWNKIQQEMPTGPTQDIGSAIKWLKDRGFNRPSSQDVLKRKRFLTEGFQFDFNEEGRTNSIRKVTMKLLRMFKAIKTQEGLTQNQTFWLSVITGGSGIGKSRLSNDMISYVIQMLRSEFEEFGGYGKDLREELALLLEGSLDAFAKQSNGTAINLDDSSESAVESWICQIIAAAYFGLESTRTVFGKSNGYFDLGKTLEDLGEIRCIILRIDEVNKFLPSSMEQLGSVTRKETNLYRVCHKIMRDVMTWATKGFFLIPILSGTIPESLYNLFPATDCKTLTLPLLPLKFSSSKMFLNNMLQQHHINMPPEDVERLVYDTGGVYRIFQFIRMALLAEKKTFGEIRKCILDEVFNFYNSPSLELKHIYSLLLWVVERRKFSTENTRMVQMAMDGLLFIGLDDVVYFPPIFFQWYSRRFSKKESFPILKSEFVESLTHFGRIDDRRFEQCVAQFINFKQNVYIANEINNVSVGKFFEGSLMGENLEKLNLDLGDKYSSYYETKVDTMSPDFTSFESSSGDVCDFSNKNISYTVWVGRQFEQFDFRTKFLNKCLKAEGKCSVRVAHGSVTGASSNTFQNEKLNAGLLPDEIFLFFTNTILSEKISPDLLNDSIIISRTQWKKSLPFFLQEWLPNEPQLDPTKYNDDLDPSLIAQYAKCGHVPAVQFLKKLDDSKSLDEITSWKAMNKRAQTDQMAKVLCTINKKEIKSLKNIKSAFKPRKVPELISQLKQSNQFRSDLTKVQILKIAETENFNLETEQEVESTGTKRKDLSDGRGDERKDKIQKTIK